MDSHTHGGGGNVAIALKTASEAHFSVLLDRRGSASREQRALAAASAAASVAASVAASAAPDSFERALMRENGSIPTETRTDPHL